MLHKQLKETMWGKLSFYPLIFQNTCNRKMILVPQETGKRIETKGVARLVRRRNVSKKRTCIYKLAGQ